MSVRTDGPLVLGIETSCDETGVGLVRGRELLADEVASSMEQHARFGGVVPAVAACRAHGITDLVIGGGAAANSRLRGLAASRCESAGIRLRVPRPGLCADNGAMVAALGASVVAAGRPPSTLALPVDSSLPVTEVLVP